MIQELMKELNQLTIQEKYNYRFVTMLDSIVAAYKQCNVTQLSTLIKNTEKLLEEYREVYCIEEILKVKCQD